MKTFAVRENRRFHGHFFTGPIARVYCIPAGAGNEQFKGALEYSCNAVDRSGAVIFGVCGALVAGRIQVPRDCHFPDPRFPRTRGRPGLVLDRSLGGVALGEPRVAVERRLGRGRHSQGQSADALVPTKAQLVFYSHARLSVLYEAYGGAGPRVIEVSTTSERYRTREGLGVGSSTGRTLGVLNSRSSVSSGRGARRNFGLLAVGFGYSGLGTVFVSYEGPPGFFGRVVRVLVANGRLTVWRRRVVL